MLIKKLFNGLETIGKNSLKFFPNEQRMHDSTQKTQGKLITNDIGHLNSIPYVLKMVFMVPKGVGPNALFVHKKLLIAYRFYFRYPSQGNTEKGFYRVGYHESFIHLFWSFRTNDKAHAGWRYFGKVMRGGKEIPTGDHIRFYDLGSFELMHRKLTNWTRKCCSNSQQYCPMRMDNMITFR